MKKRDWEYYPPPSLSHSTVTKACQQEKGTGRPTSIVRREERAVHSETNHYGLKNRVCMAITLMPPRSLYYAQRSTMLCSTTWAKKRLIIRRTLYTSHPAPFSPSHGNAKISGNPKTTHAPHAEQPITKQRLHGFCTLPSLLSISRALPTLSSTSLHFTSGDSSENRDQYTSEGAREQQLTLLGALVSVM